jgi:hypothetical protein
MCGMWSDWYLPNPRPIALASPEQTNLAPLRLVDILALAYLLLGSPTIRTIASARDRIRARLSDPVGAY